MGKLDKFTQSLESVSNAAQSVSDTAGTIAATSGNVVGSFKSGIENANGRAINDIQVNAEIGDGVKILGFGLIAALLLIFFKARKK